MSYTVQFGRQDGPLSVRPVFCGKKSDFILRLSYGPQASRGDALVARIDHLSLTSTSRNNLGLYTRPGTARPTNGARA